MKIILYYEKFLYIFRQYVALILARGGSKQIPRKNLATIEGKSLLKRTIETAKSANVFQDVWVSTDDLEIYTEAAAAGAKVFGRSQESSTDNAGSIIAVLEFYALFPNFTAVALIQCTSPFLSTLYLRKAHFMMDQLGYDSVFSVTPNYKLLWTKNVGDFITPLNFNAKFRPRRQDFKWQWMENGMFYWFRPEVIELGVLQGGKTGIVEIPSERSLEIDTFDDLDTARHKAPKLLSVLRWEELSCFHDEH
ncbi:hypothetical protein V9T40_012444 [Parthenolecanium corni]|uniref:N-acylneuraminate cytidylyltransferase n=1 Tax=Parthenolecanium corni TaxID=536013 RepID=A0AAN9TB42_9HEMI